MYCPSDLRSIALSSNRVVIRFHDGQEQSLEASSAYAAQLAFEAVAKALSVTGLTVESRPDSRPARFRSVRTALATVQGADNEISSFELWQRGRMGAPAMQRHHEVLTDPAYSMATQLQAQAELSVGIAQVCILGGQDLIDHCFPNAIVGGSLSEAARENADRQPFTLARSVIDVLRAAVGEEMPERIEALERARQDRVFGRD